MIRERLGLAPGHSREEEGPERTEGGLPAPEPRLIHGTATRRRLSKALSSTHTHTHTDKATTPPVLYR